ncbi:hypothetical protein B0H15DRAFT_872774 [Mycena belliarum]|uniref:Uncharacterized protein n=1 Tax=Mycena belliarum TaxID=1033014 RepID=A0AAD6TNN9_9AGAR|nr:hypothetical protein B0H15DRAFT_872774 [Mycena belliae]
MRAMPRGAVAARKRTRARRSWDSDSQRAGGLQRRADSAQYRHVAAAGVAARRSEPRVRTYGARRSDSQRTRDLHPRARRSGPVSRGQAQGSGDFRRNAPRPQIRAPRPQSRGGRPYRNRTRRAAASCDPSPARAEMSRASASALANSSPARGGFPHRTRRTLRRPAAPCARPTRAPGGKRRVRVGA